MSRRSRPFVACLMVLALVLILFSGCAEEKEEGKVPVVIGFVSDFSGAASSALRVLWWNVTDFVKYTNEEDPIPGVELKIVSYDTKYDTARDLPGYEWVKDKGAQVILAPIGGTVEAMKPFAAEDKIPLWCGNATLPVVEPPGWAFAPMPLEGALTKTLLEWISTQWDYSQGKPKIASVSWDVTTMLERVRGAREYCQEHPDKFEYLGDAIAPPGAATWAGEIVKVKDCDLINVACGGTSAATFINEFRSKGYNQRIIATYSMWAFQSMMEEKAGKEALDGSWFASPIGWWGDPSPVWDLLELLLSKYRAGEAESIKRDFGPAYPAAMVPLVVIDIIREAVAEVGAENFDGEVFYNTAVKWRKTYGGFDEWTFADGKRYAARHVKIYEYQADVGGPVQLTEWLPIVED